MIHRRDEDVLGPEPPLGSEHNLRSVRGKRADLQDGCSQCPRALLILVSEPARSEDSVATPSCRHCRTVG